MKLYYAESDFLMGFRLVVAANVLHAGQLLRQQDEADGIHSFAYGLTCILDDTDKTYVSSLQHLRSRELGKDREW